MAIETAATLLERERELAALTTALDDAQSGSGRVILVEAPAGLGKTRLLTAGLESAGDMGFTALRARASDLERDFAYGCVRQLLDPLVARMADGDREHVFADAAGFAKSLLAPGGAPHRPSVVPATSAFAMLHALYWLLNNIADDSPVALCIDDLHWADSESLRFLNFLTPRLDGLAMIIIGTARTGEPDSGELHRLAAAPETRVLRPRPLSLAATEALCEARLGAEFSPEFAYACREATGGNPFLLEALLHEVITHDFGADAAGAARLREIGPAAVARAIVLRLSGRPSTATSLVRAVAILGDRCSVIEAADLAELSVAEAARAADLLADLAILASGDELEFVHPIVREAVYADIGIGHRAIAHARAAELLEASGAADERVAAQIAQAEPTGDLHRIELLRRVAADALARGAPEAAAAWLGRALEERPPPELRGVLLVELTSAQLRLGAPEAAVEPLTEAAKLVTQPPMIVRAVRLLASALTWLGKADRGVAAISHAIDRLAGEHQELALVLEAERAAYAQQGSFELRAPVSGWLAPYAGLPGDTPAERLVLAALAYENARASERASDAADHIVRALGHGRLLEEQDTDVVGTLYLLALSLIHTDALDCADRCMDDMVADAQARASIPAHAFAIVHRGWVALRRGAVAHAEADARTALDLLTTHDILLGTRFALALLIAALVERGELEEAERALRDSGYGEDIPPGMASNSLLRARGLLHLAQGRAREAVADLTQFGRNDELFGAANPLAVRWRSEASVAHVQLGELDEARRLAADDLERARRWGAPSGIGVALLALAQSETEPASLERLREAVSVLEGSPARLEHARALTDLGAALRRANRRSEARRALHGGLRVAEQCGARALVTRARTELRAAGGRSSDRYGSGVEQLTASEQRVAELAAQGLTNPEIAQTLFVTRKTIETHLGHVYRKLDISGRGKLVHALAQGER